MVKEFKVMKGNSIEITQEEIQEIERLTGGKIGTHTFGPNNEHTLENSFLSPDGTYIGSMDEARWYVKNQMMVDEDYPHGVAGVITPETYGTENPVIEGMYGYTHRGGNMFKIGDRLFYKGHIHCTIMDIIQENLSFVYEVNMSLNNKNKIVDEWELFEKKQNVFVDVETGLKKQVKEIDKVKKKVGRPKKNVTILPKSHDEKPIVLEHSYYTTKPKSIESIDIEELEEYEKLSFLIKEVENLKKMIANLTELVLKQNKNV